MCISNPWDDLCNYIGGFLKWWVKPQQTHGVYLPKMIILGCEMGVPSFKETPILTPKIPPRQNQQKDLLSGVESFAGFSCVVYGSLK